jgi:hypothetical protein
MVERVLSTRLQEPFELCDSYGHDSIESHDQQLTMAQEILSATVVHTLYCVSVSQDIQLARRIRGERA